jgi:Asp-tRNA(Asn)/Glu-tRNA(Gln) amidotransferase A subunit family amidase
MVATQGRVSRAGIVPRSLTHDRAGPLGRSVYDVAVMMDAIAGFDPEDLDTRAGLGHYLEGGGPSRWPCLTSRNFEVVSYGKR